MKFTQFLKSCFRTVAPDTNYSDNWHIKVISDRLEAALSGKIKRLIINVPPRSMKSICVSVAWPAWILGLNPKSRIIVASYSQILSEKLSLDTRYILQSQWYSDLFPGVIISREQNTKSKFQTTQLGYRFATSVGGSLTGEGGNFLIVDDPMNPMQSESKTYREKVCNWFDHSLLTRLNDRKTGVVVVVMHRLHTEDLTGHLLSKRDTKKWHHLSIPLVSIRTQKIYSIAAPCVLRNLRMTRKILYVREKEKPIRRSMSARYIEDLKGDVGAYAFAAQYQQSPIDNLGSGIIKRSWFRRYIVCNTEELCIAQSWDTASSAGTRSNYSTCTTWAFNEKNFFLLAVERVRAGYTALKNLVLRLQNTWKPSAILIENKASGLQLIQELQNQIPVISINPNASKIVRVHRISPLIESGLVFLPCSAAWLCDFEQEVCSFPNSNNDDQVDSMTQFLLWAYRSMNRVPQIRKL